MYTLPKHPNKNYKNPPTSEPSTKPNIQPLSHCPLSDITTTKGDLDHLRPSLKHSRHPRHPSGHQRIRWHIRRNITNPNGPSIDPIRFPAKLHHASRVWEVQIAEFLSLALVYFPNEHVRHPGRPPDLATAAAAAVNDLDVRAVHVHLAEAGYRKPGPSEERAAVRSVGGDGEVKSLFGCVEGVFHGTTGTVTDERFQHFEGAPGVV